MSWRIIVITGRAKMDLQLGYMVVRSEEITKVALNEISMVLIESTAVSITTSLLAELAKRKVKVIFCDEKRNPCSELVNYYGSHDTSNKVRKQIAWKQSTKEAVWTEIVTEKIRKQKETLEYWGKEEAQLLSSYLNEITWNDGTNREGHAAKVYFNALFGLDFTRTADIPVNAALNYGYSIILSAFTREVVANGYITQLGLFHDNMFNQFNLASDLMEPFRPLVDQKVARMQITELEQGEKMQIVDILNQEVVIDGKTQYVNNAIKIYKDAIALDETSSDAYLGLLDTYAYYYDATQDAEKTSSEGMDSGAKLGVRYVTKYIDKVQDDVVYEVAILYYNEIQDYKAAMQYFNQVNDKENFPDEAAQASYYSAICENKIKKNSNFANSQENLFNFEEYNSSNLEDTNTSKYVNYLNIASIYVDNLGSEADDMPQRTIALLQEANEKLDENSTALSNAFPEDRNVKYYTAQYARILYSVYSYEAENATTDDQRESFYLKAVDALNRYLASIDITDKNISDNTKKSYVKYMKEEAETYIALAVSSGKKDYYDSAEKIYKTAEDSMGTEDFAADIYVSHLNYLYDRYSGEYGSNPKKWRSEGISKVQAVYNAGKKINILANRGNNEWNSLIVNSAIAGVIDGTAAAK